MSSWRSQSSLQADYRVRLRCSSLNRLLELGYQCRQRFFAPLCPRSVIAALFDALQFRVTPLFDFAENICRQIDWHKDIAIQFKEAELHAAVHDAESCHRVVWHLPIKLHSIPYLANERVDVLF